MTILEELIQSIKGDAPIRQVIVSTHSTVVCSRGCGLATTQLSTKPHGEEFIRDAGSLHFKSAKELAQYALSANPLEASIGLAAINSMLEINQKELQPMDAVDLAIKLAVGKRIVFVGHFPYIPKVSRVATECRVLELNPVEGEYSPERAKDFLPQAEFVILTAVTIITHALEYYLSLCSPKTIVMLSGPSTPLSQLLFNYPINILTGLIIEDEAQVVRAVSQGANIRQMRGIRKVTISKKEAIRS